MLSRRGPVVLVCALFLAGPFALAATAEAGENPLFCLPLHAEIGIHTCPGHLSEPCYYTPHTVDVPPDTTITVFLFVHFYERLRGVQTAFEWDPGWTLVGGAWDCQVNQLNLTTPHDPGGPREGTLATAFDCLVSPETAVIGRLFFLSGTGGCLRQVEPDFALGIHVLDCRDEIDWLDPGRPEFSLRLGRICVESGGQSGCWDPWPVEPTTWGAIKSSYSPRR